MHCGVYGIGSVSHSVVSNSLQPRGLYSSWNSPGQNTGVGSLLHGIFPPQGSNPVGKSTINDNKNIQG